MSKFKVLLVDDEREFITTLGERMQMRGFDPEFAFSGEQALNMLKDSLPDVMVLDLKMPGIDGLEVLRRVKKDYPQVQVIILTGHGSGREEAATRRMGAFDHLKKPVDINDLVRIMELAFRQKPQEEKLA
jgi:DNA-binding response OmpR family regulator